MKLSHIILITLSIIPQILFAAGPERYQIDIHDHRASPSITTIPARTKIQLEFNNHTHKTEIIGSSVFNQKVVIDSKGSATVDIRPLSPGVYYYSSEVHSRARGRLIVK